MHPIPPTLALLLAASTLCAATWTGGGDGHSWNDSGNWTDGAMPGSGDWVWDIGADTTVILDGAAPGDRIVKTGNGVLRMGPKGRASSVQVRQGTFEFPDIRLWSEVELQGGTVRGMILQSPVVASGGTLAARTEDRLTLAGDIQCDYADSSGQLMLAGATIQGDLNASGTVFLMNGAGASKVDGHLHLAAGSALCWDLQDPARMAPLIVTGELSSDYAMWLYFGAVDWTQPYWDQSREFTFVDAWEGGIVTATLMPDLYAGNEAEGAWNQVEAADGDIVMRWTPTDARFTNVAAVPEASAAPWLLALTLIMVIARVRQKRLCC